MANAEPQSLESNKNTARLAAGIFFLLCWPGSSYGAGYSVSKVFVAGNAVATANNLLEHEFVFRTGIVSHLVSVLAFAFMSMLFYRIFHPVDKHLSRLMIIPPIIHLVNVFILEVIHFTALLTMKGDTFVAMELTQKQELVYFLFRLHRYGMGMDQLFIGLWLFPLGMLLYKSDYAPRFVSILAMIGGGGYFAEGCLYVLLQRAEFLTIREVLRFTYLIAFAPSMFWFLIKGVRTPRRIAEQPA